MSNYVLFMEKNIGFFSYRAVTMKGRPAMFHDVILYNTSEIHQRFGRTYCLHLQGRKATELFLRLTGSFLGLAFL
jgi:hypothetical protein